MRHNDEGTRPYHSSSHTGLSMASIHDHSNNIRTIGMGEVIAVLNGVEFRTRHNDYGLRMPVNGSSTYHQVEDIPFPDVPPEVTQHENIDDQIAEMREWFKAWKKQDNSVRDYRKYFKANLCYMEGCVDFLGRVGGAVRKRSPFSRCQFLVRSARKDSLFVVLGSQEQS